MKSSTLPPPKTADEYLGRLPEKTQTTLEKLRKTIRKFVPGCEETITYGIIVFKLDGKGLVGIAGFDKHCGFYIMSPAVAKKFAKELEAYDTATATVRFPIGKSLPAELVKGIVDARVAENKALLAKSKTKAKSVVKAAKKAAGTDPAEEVNSYMKKLEHPMKASVEKLRKAIRAAAPQLNERIKWNAPSYYLNKDLFTFSLHNPNHIVLVFHHPSIVKIKSPLLEGTYKDRRLTYFRSAKDVNTHLQSVQRIIQELVQLATPS